MGFAPPPLITHDRDFRATGDYIKSLRDREGHPASWKDPKLVSTDQTVKPHIKYRPVSEFLAANQQPKSAGQQKRLKVRENLKISPAILALATTVLTMVVPSTHTCQIWSEKLERMRNVTSSMIAEAIHTDEFKGICQSDNAREDLELFFARTASNDQLHYVYSKLWTAIDFGFVMDNNVRPNAQEEQVRKDVRQIIKWGFGFAAADYFNLCSDNETLDTNTLVDKESQRLEDHDAVYYDHDQARSMYKGGWRQLVINWKMAKYSHGNLNVISKDAGRLPATEMFNPGKTRELGEESLVE